MKVAMMQPTFMPWLGFFELVYISETFVILDDFQFSVQGWDQRNRLFVNKNQVDWYTIPIKKSESFLKPFNMATINESIPWRSKMLKRIQQNYSKAPYFQEIYSLVENWLLTVKQSLAEQNMLFIDSVCECLDIRREFRKSSDYKSINKRSKRVLDLLEWCQATHYYSAKGSFTYMFEDELFPIECIQVLFQDYHHKPYLQVGSPNEFIPYLSIIDTLMNIGPHNTCELIKHGTTRWLTWDEMMRDRTQPESSGIIKDI
jgi:hypothetical protein